MNSLMSQDLVESSLTSAPIVGTHLLSCRPGGKLRITKDQWDKQDQFDCFLKKATVNCWAIDPAKELNLVISWPAVKFKISFGKDTCLYPVYKKYMDEAF